MGWVGFTDVSKAEPTNLVEKIPHQLFYQGANRVESSQKIVQKIWKISQITSKCHVATNGSGDKNLPNNETRQIGQIWGNSRQICGKIGDIPGNYKYYYINVIIEVVGSVCGG